ncbi:MAG: BRO-N domain-containing protein, partial [Actinomycetes bacterium]
MSSIIPFTFPETGQPVRTVTIDSEPWWFVADVCSILGLANVGNVVARLDDADVSSIRIT